MFEQNYKKHQWWIDKKARIQKMIDTNDTKQMEVRYLTPLSTHSDLNPLVYEGLLRAPNLDLNSLIVKLLNNSLRC